MKIDLLKINSRFKNLDNLKIDFAEDSLMTVVIGWNGSGKSNVIEALVQIFRNIDLGESPAFDFEIVYSLGEKGDDRNPLRWIRIEAKREWGTTANSQYKVFERRDGQKDLLGDQWDAVSFSKVKRNKSGETEYLPQHLFAYYSGPSDRLEKYFRKHRTDFYKKLLDSKLKMRGEIRPLFYAKPIHSQFVLLAFFLGQPDSDERDFLKEHLGIEELDSVHFVFRRPGWAQRKNWNEIFWGARGTMRDFLDLVIPHAIAPIKVSRNEDSSLTGKKNKNEFFHMLLPNIEALRDMCQELSEDELFKMLESILLSELLSEVRIRVKKKGADQPLSFSELSEGEQQLLTVLGLLKFTGGKDTLFLLDEPDTHLNPKWTVDYISFLKRFVPNQNTSHLITVTHHPLAIAELSKDQVQIMWNDKDFNVWALPPEQDPKGMGYEGILTSDMFGLGSALDKETTKDLLKLHNLSTKENLTPEEKVELETLRESLLSLDFNFASKDRLEREFTRARFDLAKDGEFGQAILTAENKERALKALVKSLLGSLSDGEES